MITALAVRSGILTKERGHRVANFEASVSAPSEQSRFLVVTHLGRLQTIALPESGTFTVGRAAPNDLHLDESLVSRYHAVLHLGETIYIEDLDSQNGVTMTGSEDLAEISLSETAVESSLPPHEKIPVPDGAVIHIGSAAMSVQRLIEPDHEVGPDGALVADPAMRHLYALVERIAESDINVLLLGESGVGKEVIASRLHSRSMRRGHAFVAINCGAISEALLESELFGHERGAFTGAVGSKVGLLESARGGVVFLDEIGEMPLALQVKLLRVIESRKVMAVGSVKQKELDVRFVAATNRDLKREAADGTFRNDLYYRLNGISLWIPPLRERQSEIIPLAEHFLAREVDGDRVPPTLSARARRALISHPWPGNVRELKNAITRALVFCDGVTIEPGHLGLTDRSARDSQPVPVDARDADGTTPHGIARQPSAAPLSPDDLRRQAEELERKQVLEALEASDGNQTAAAKRLGITRRALIGRLDKFGIARPRKK